MTGVPQHRSVVRGGYLNHDHAQMFHHLGRAAHGPSCPGSIEHHQPRGGLLHPRFLGLTVNLPVFLITRPRILRPDRKSSC